MFRLRCKKGRMPLARLQNPRLTDSNDAGCGVARALVMGLLCCEMGVLNAVAGLSVVVGSTVAFCYRNVALPLTFNSADSVSRSRLFSEQSHRPMK